MDSGGQATALFEPLQAPAYPKRCVLCRLALTASHHLFISRFDDAVREMAGVCRRDAEAALSEIGKHPGRLVPGSAECSTSVSLSARSPTKYCKTPLIAEEWICSHQISFYYDLLKTRLQQYSRKQTSTRCADLLASRGLMGPCLRFILARQTSLSIIQVCEGLGAPVLYGTSSQRDQEPDEARCRQILPTRSTASDGHALHDFATQER